MHLDLIDFRAPKAKEARLKPEAKEEELEPESEEDDKIAGNNGCSQINPTSLFGCALMAGALLTLFV